MSLRGMWKAEGHGWACQGQGWHLGYLGEVEGECSGTGTDLSPWARAAHLSPERHKYTLGTRLCQYLLFFSKAVSTNFGCSLVPVRFSCFRKCIPSRSDAKSWNWFCWCFIFVRDLSLILCFSDFWTLCFEGYFPALTNFCVSDSWTVFLIEQKTFFIWKAVDFKVYITQNIARS